MSIPLNDPLDDYGTETQIRYCLNQARNLLESSTQLAEDRSILADAWMRLAEAWSDRAADFVELEDELNEEDEDEITEQRRFLARRPK